MKILETERLILRTMDENDFNGLKAVISDPVNMKYYPNPYDDEGVIKWINWCKASQEKHGFSLWALILKENNKFIGDCGISMQNINGKLVPEIGYHLRLDCHHKGYIFEASRAVKDYFFSNFNFDEVFSYMNDQNYDSKCVAIRNGMYFREEYSNGDEKLAVYSITREEWKTNLTIKPINTSFNKIVLLGSPGSGKSYLSLKLREKLNIPVCHLDCLYWKEGWVGTDQSEFIKKQEDFMKRSKWIMDGSYASSLRTRLSKCDTVILLDMPIDTCIKNEESRRGKPREDLPSYLEEKLDPEFIQYIKDYPDTNMRLVRAYMSCYPNIKIITLHSKNEVNDFLNNITE